jgi:UDP-glucose 4-epimerase
MASERFGRVLVTGGAGFIGSELIRQLAGCASDVIVVDNLCNGKRENIAEALSDGVRFEATDIRDEDTMRSHMQGVDVVLHLACLGVRHSIHSPLENHTVNASATLSLLEMARTVGVSRFVYVSSSEIYGTARTVPMTEKTPAFPHTVYGASKLAGDCYTRAYFDTYEFPTVVVRPFNSYGPRSHHEGDSGEVIPKFLLRTLSGRPMIVFGDGTQTRDFTYVSDTAKAILLAAEREEAVGRTINVGYGAELTVNELAKTVSQVLGREDAVVEHVESRPGDVLRLYADTSLARELLGYEASVSLKDGLERLLAWHRERGVDPEELLKDEVERNWEIDT